MAKLDHHSQSLHRALPKAPAAALARQQEGDVKRRELDRKREVLEARITSLRKEFDAEAEEALRIVGQDAARDEVIRLEQERMEVRRGIPGNGASSKTRGRTGKPAGERR